MAGIDYYYKLEKLSDILKNKHNISSNSRFDCTEFWDTKNRLLKHVNTEGKLYFNIRSKNFYRREVENQMNISEFRFYSKKYCLSDYYKGSLNHPSIGFGTLHEDSNKFQKDLLLFLMDDNLEQLEILGFEGNWRDRQVLFYKLQSGKLNEELEAIRMNSSAFYDYDKGQAYFERCYNKQETLSKNNNPTFTLNELYKNGYSSS